MIKQIIVIALLVNYSLAACTSSSVDADATGVIADTNQFNIGKCCWTTASISVQHSSVATCAAKPAVATVEEGSAATCNVGAGLVSGVCTACLINTIALAGNLTPCTNCLAGTTAAAGLGVCTNCAAGTTSVAGAACLACPNGSTTLAGAATCTACTDGQTLVANVCGSRDAGATAIVGCGVYAAATGGNCLRALDGFITITATAGILLPVKCIDNCKTCADATTCSAAKDGYYLNNTTPATPVITVCPTDCAKCTWTAGVGTAAAVINCTAAKAGAYLDKTVATAAVAKRCAVGMGAPDMNTGELVSCVACTAANNCNACTTVAFCTSCKPNFVFTSATGKCDAFTGVKHGTCDAADGIAATNCMKCIDTQNRELNADDDPDSTTTPKAKKTVGTCKCKAEFGDKSGATPPDFICEACGPNAASCTWDAQGMKVPVCQAGFLPAGSDCWPKTATDTGKYFFDAAASAFKMCDASCAKCSAEKVCTACGKKDQVPFVEPGSADATFTTYIKGDDKILVNSLCVSDCPVATHTQNSAKTGCVAKATSGSGAAAASNGIMLSIISLVASLLIIF